MNRFENLIRSPAMMFAILTIAMFMVASGNVIGRAVHETIPPVGLAFWRTLVPIVVLAPFAIPDVLAKRALIAAHWRALWLVGALQVVPQASMLIAVNFTTAINATLISASQPVATAVIAWFLIHDRVNAAQGLGIAAALGGVVVMVSRADLGVIVGFDFNGGDLLVLVSITIWSFYNIKLLQLPSAIGLSTTLFLISTFGSATVLPFYIAETIFYRPVPVDGLTAITVGVMGLGISTGAVFAWNRALGILGPHRTTVFVNLIPFFGTILAIAFLGERLFLFHLAGVVMVAIGISLVILGGRQRKPAMQD